MISGKNNRSPAETPIFTRFLQIVAVRQKDNERFYGI